MQRRAFFGRTAVAALAPASALTPLAALLPASALARTQADPHTAWREVFDAAREDYDPVTVRFSGRLPVGLVGTLYRNGPGLSRRGPTRYRHWFDGDGLIQAYTIGNGRLLHRARSVRTARFQAEQAAGRYLWDGFGTHFNDAQPASRPDDQNPANISLLDSGDELLALWEAGSPYRIDPKTLASKGRKVYSEETDGMPFSAHPRVDRDGTVWSFGYMAGSGKLALYRIDRTGRLLRSALIDAPNADMVHDFAITERFLVFVLMPLMARERGAAPSLLERYELRREQATVVLVIDKDSLEIRHRAELPAMTLFHLGNAWEDGRSLRIQVMRVGDFKWLMDAMYASFAGQPTSSPAAGPSRQTAVAGGMAQPGQSDDGIIEVVFDRDHNRATIERIHAGVCDFPAFDRRRTGLATDTLIALRPAPSLPHNMFGLNELVAVDRRRGRIDSFDYGRNRLAEEHLYVPGPAGSAGWILGTTYDWVRRRTALNVFNASAVMDGPIAQAELPRGLPLGLHGVFRPA